MIDHCGKADSLFIGIPCYDGKAAAQTLVSVATACIALTMAGVKVLPPCTLIGCCYLDHLRNQLLDEFKRSGAGDCLLVDADVGFMPDTAVRVCNATRPIVGAIYPKKSDTEAWPVEFYPGDRYADDDGLTEVKMLPTGFMRINRAVLDQLDRPEFGLKRYADPFTGRELVAYFENDIREQFYGEDVEFCRRWRENGGRLRIIPDALLSHTGPKTWAGNIGEAMKAGRI